MDVKRADRRARFEKSVRYTVIIGSLIFFAFPVLWIVLTSFKTPSEFLSHPPVWLPHSPSLVHYFSVVKLGGYTALKNSLIIASVATAFSLVIGSIAAYAMARFNTGGKHLALWMLSQRMLPPITIVFPAFLLFRTVGWIDTYQAVILMHLTFNLPYVVWMMRGFFKEIPLEIEESAQVDGCSTFGAFWHVSLPLAAPGLVATGVFAFIFSWSEFVFALVLSRTEAVPLAVQLPRYFGDQMTFWGEIGALSTVAMLPIFFLTMLGQRYLVRGLTMGAVKS